MSTEPSQRLVTIVLAVNPDAEDDLPIDEAARLSLTGGCCSAIDEKQGERIVSVDVDRPQERVRLLEEALRELLDRGQPETAAGMTLMARARKLVDDVERTHALVPIDAVRRCAHLAREAAAHRYPSRSTTEDRYLADCLSKASKGETPDWPEAPR